MGDDTEILSNALSTFESLTKKPELYLSIQNDNACKIKSILKNLYDFTKSIEESNSNNNALPRLITDNFDEEQIWQQLELQNNSCWNGFITNVSRLHANKNNLQFYPNSDVLDNGLVQYENESDDQNNSADERNESQNDYLQNEQDNENSSGDEDLFERFSRDKSKSKKGSAKKTKTHYRKSIVDDKFFKLGELEQFLIEEDRKQMNGGEKSHNDSDSEGSINLFEDMDSDLFPDNGDDNSDKNSDDEDDREKYPKYEDFFDAPDGMEGGASNKSIDDQALEDSDINLDNLDDEDISEEDEENPRKKKISKFDGIEGETSNKSIDEQDLEDSDINLDDLDDEDMSEEVDENERQKKVRFQFTDSESDDDSSNADLLDKSENVSENDKEEKSTFEIRQERLKKKIHHLENAKLAEKPWQLKGEIDAANRPQNSLLEEVLEFDLSSRPAPVITQETTLKLEDIIRRRIKDKAWDDVERKIKPVHTPLEYKKELVLNQEKSKESLAQIYEQEYLKQKAALDPEYSEKAEEEPKEHTEIKQMMSTLFTQLDALSNFHYTPKPVTAEVKIVNNLPAISMEEVAPVATSDATLLAPEEICKKPKGDIMSKDERTKTDKNRERRQKKLRQRFKHRAQERKEKLNPSNNKYDKDNQSKLINKLSKDRNIEKLVSNNKSTKSSQAFFTQLQEEVKGQINSKLSHNKKQEKSKLSAKKFKL